MEDVPTLPTTLEGSIRLIVDSHIERLKRGATDHPGIDGFGDAFEFVRSALRPFPLDHRPPLIPLATLQPYFKDLYLNRLIGSMLDWFLQEVRSNQHMITTEIQSQMAEYAVTGDIDIVQRMLARVLEWWEAWGTYVSLFNPYLEGTLAFRRVCSVHLNEALPPSFRPAFRALIVSTFPSEANNNTLDATRTSAIFNVLASLGLLADHEHYVGSILKAHATGHLRAVCEGEWGRPLWGEMREWFDRVMTPWVRLAYVRDWMRVDSRAVVEPVAAKYQWHMCEALGELRTSEIFDIIVDYPDSLPALMDLKECLFQTGSRLDLVSTLRASTKKRLLHPGADTKDIITQYISTIRCLRVLDPMGSLLFSIADPIRQYLRERPDTIRTIVQNLIEPKGEFAGDDDGEIKPLQDTQHLSDDYGDFGWMPEPADADAAFRTTKPTDIISTLVSIYDSKDIFVKELQVLLGKRLLEVKGQDYDAEIRNLEILKLRFGDAPLQVCDVMMKDITDSRRADQHIHNARKADTAVRANDGSPLPMHTTIISRLFWPPIPSNQLVMPGQFRRFQEDYAKAFSKFKPDRKVRFLSNLGTVTLDLEFSDRKLSVEDVTPLQAAIAELFSSQEVLSTDDIAETLGGVDIPNIDKAMEFWMDHGVVKPIGNKQYKILEVAEEGCSGIRPVRRAVVVEEEHGAMEVEERQAEQMRVYWQFIQGMLTNFQSLPTDRIHTMLKFAPDYDRTREQLASFMEALKRENLVDFRDGSWRLVRSENK